eukprot:gene14795-20846_t
MSSRIRAMDNSRLSQNISGRFGGGRVARDAAERALRQLQPGDPEYDGMFEDRVLSPSGLNPAQHDPLDAEAFHGAPMQQHVPSQGSGATQAMVGEQYMDTAAQQQMTPQQMAQYEHEMQQQLMQTSPSRSGTPSARRSSLSPGGGRTTSDPSGSEGTSQGPRYVTRKVRISPEPSYPSSSRSPSASPPPSYRRRGERETGVRSPITSPNGPNGRVGIASPRSTAVSTGGVSAAPSAGRSISSSGYGAAKYLTSGYRTVSHPDMTSTSSAQAPSRPRRRAPVDPDTINALSRPTAATSNSRRDRVSEPQLPPSVAGRPAWGGGSGRTRVQSRQTRVAQAAMSQAGPTRRPVLPAWVPPATAAVAPADRSYQPQQRRQPGALQDDDEAAIIAATLNNVQPQQSGDPGEGPERAEFSFSPNARQPQAGVAMHQGSEPSTQHLHHPQHPHESQHRPVTAPGQGTGGGNVGAWAGNMLVGQSMDQRRRQSLDRVDEVYQRYRTKEHRNDLPAYKYSQPRSFGPHVPVTQKMFGFDDAHPGIAEEHFLRSPKQNKMLEKERMKEAERTRRAEEGAARERLRGSPIQGVPSAQRLRADVTHLARSRQAGRNRLNELEEEAEGIRHRSREIGQRAMEAIARSAHITGRSRSSSPGMGRAVRYRPSRSVSPPGGTWSGSPGRLGPGYRPATAVAYGRSPCAGKPYSSAGGSGLRPLSAPMGPSGYEDLGQMNEYSYDQYGDMDEDAIFDDEGYDGGDYGADADRYPQPGNSLPRSSLPHPHSPPPYTSGSPQRDQYAPHNASGSSGGNGYTERSDDDSGYRVYMDERNGGVFVDTAGRQAEGGRVGGPSINEDEFRMAAGAFDPHKFAEYNRQVDMEMERRALEEGYESDQERERNAMDAMDSLTKAQRSELERQEEEGKEMAELLQETWQEQDSWMDFYRNRLGPNDGYHFNEQQEGDEGGYGQGEPRSTHSSPGPRHQYLVDQYNTAGLNRGYLSEEEEMYTNGDPFLHTMTGKLRAEGLHSILRDPPANIRRSMFKPTVPLAPFTFEEREKNKPKSIHKVKLEQDLALKRREDEAINRLRFHASPMPKSVMQPRYAAMTLQREVQRQVNREQRIMELHGQIQQPFSFEQREAERQAHKETYMRDAKDPNRFQVPFKAKGVPLHMREERFKLMQIQMEEKRGDARSRAEMARLHAKERVKAETAERVSEADRAYKNRLHAVDPIWNQRYETRPPGAVPDYNAMHAQWEMDAARIRANNRRRITVPNEFKLNGGTPADQAERQHKSLERRQRIILDMQLDSELLPEMRWPYTTPRGRVRPVPPPATVDNLPDYKIAETRANMLRIAYNKGMMKRGQYDMKDERDRKALDKARKEAMVRAQTWMTIQQDIQRKKGGVSEVDISGLGGEHGGGGTADAMMGGGGGGSGLSVADRREALASRSQAPVQYIEARHAQAEKKARGIVEDELLKQGLDTYKYVEG